jgi:hypothetical protein
MEIVIAALMVATVALLALMILAIVAGSWPVALAYGAGAAITWALGGVRA